MTKTLKITVDETGRVTNSSLIQNDFDYLTESERTASAKFHGELVDFAKFLDTLSKVMSAAEELDRYKKLLFYGEDARKLRVGDTKQLGEYNGHAIIARLEGLTCEVSKAEQAVHAILGIATEAGELVQALFTALDPKSGGLDFVNALEEVGDLQWYEAMLCRITGKTFDDVQRTNIAKLRQRFPDKFTSLQANERDLERERAILETGGAPISGRVTAERDEGIKSMPERIKALRDVTAVAKSLGNAGANDYMRGMANGLILAVSCIDDAEPAYIKPAGPVVGSHLEKLTKPFRTHDGNKID